MNLVDSSGWLEYFADTDRADLRIPKMSRELHQYGAYRTRRLVLEAWERMQEPPG